MCVSLRKDHDWKCSSLLFQMTESNLLALDQFIRNVDRIRCDINSIKWNNGVIEKLNGIYEASNDKKCRSKQLRSTETTTLLAALLEFSSDIFVLNINNSRKLHVTIPSITLTCCRLSGVIWGIFEPPFDEQKHTFQIKQSFFIRWHFDRSAGKIETKIPFFFLLKIKFQYIKSWAKKKTKMLPISTWNFVIGSIAVKSEKKWIFCGNFHSVLHWKVELSQLNTKSTLQSPFRISLFESPCRHVYCL